MKMWGCGRIGLKLARRFVYKRGLSERGKEKYQTG